MLDRDNRVFDAGGVKIRKEGSIGKNLFEIGALRGKEPLDFLIDMLLEEENAAGMVLRRNKPPCPSLFATICHDFSSMEYVRLRER
jgi:N-acyl-D-aspartate/D-glutamate deacylase